MCELVIIIAVMRRRQRGRWRKKGACVLLDVNKPTILFRVIMYKQSAMDDA